MKIINKKIVINSKLGIGIIDLNDKIKKMVYESKITSGFLVAFSKHTTAGLKINENVGL